MKLFNEGRLRVCGVMTGTCNLSSLEVEAERGHEFEANVDNMAHLGFTINPVSRKIQSLTNKRSATTKQTSRSPQQR